MKKKLLKRLTGIAVTVAMTVTMVTGTGVTVYAAAHPDWPTEVHTDDCNHQNTSHFWLVGTFTHESTVVVKGCLFTYTPWGFLSPQNFDEDALSFLRSNDFESTTPGWYYGNGGKFCPCSMTPPPTPPTPTPTPEPKKEEVKEVDRDTYKSEEPYGTAGVTNTNSKIGDLKVHKVNATTETNQKFLADAFAKQSGKKARILKTVSVHPRRALGVDNGKKEALIYANLEKKPQTVYAVCYNQTDKAYYLTGTLDKDGVATFPGFILRDATNITIFVLE